MTYINIRGYHLPLKVSTRYMCAVSKTWFPNQQEKMIPLHILEGPQYKR